MADAALWHQLIAYWQGNGCAARPGASVVAIESFQQRYQVVLPKDLRDYFEAADGQCENFGNDLLRFWPLSEVKPVSEELDSDIHTERHDYPGYFVFADYLIWSWGYAVKMGSSSDFEAPVHCLTGEKHTRQIASSFAEFMQMYLTDLNSIMPWLSKRITTSILMKAQNYISIAEEPEDNFNDDLRPEHTREDLKNGGRGKYLAQFRSGTNQILLDPDVARAFPTAAAVNEALRRLMQS